MTEVQRIEEKGLWDSHILEAGGHPLQLWGWGEVKEVHHWQADRVEVVRNGKSIGFAQLLLRKLPGPFRMLAYIPRGPVVPEKKDREEVASELAAYVKQRYHAVSLTIEPDWEEAIDWKDWRQSSNTILIPRTLILNLDQSEEELMSQVAAKTRWSIRKSERYGVSVRKVANREELVACLAIYKETAKRARFALHEDSYYYDIFDKLGEHSSVFVALFEGKPVAFLWLAISESTAFELYGGMNTDAQRLRANYTLKWQAIQAMKKWGIRRYDFNGLLNDGVSTFKQGFASHETMLAGTYDKPLSPLYMLWTKGLPVAKSVIRRLRRK